ncbi:MAG: DUF6152 family protein [Pseudomonadota bacterium]
MNNVRNWVIGAIVSFVVLPAAAWAHHSAAGRFDPGSTMQLEGTVTSVSWRNPHITMKLETTNEKGESEEWLLEAGSPNILGRAGIRKGAIEVGDFIRVAGWPPVTDRKEVFLSNILTPDGDELLLILTSRRLWDTGNKENLDLWNLFRREGDGSKPELGLFRVWTGSFNAPYLFPQSLYPNFDLSVYNLTDAAWEAVKNYDGLTENPTLDCQPKGMPIIMEQIFPTEFVDEGDRILLRIEEYDLVRVFHMEEDAATANREPSPLGYSVGEWEDDRTFVVTTTDINSGWFDQEGIPLSLDAVVVERFIVSEDGSRLDYTMTVTDDVNFKEPVELGKYWLYIPGMQVEPYDCVVNE